MLAKNNGEYWLDTDSNAVIPMRNTACRCCGKNEMQQEVIDYYSLLLRFVDEGELFITSGYRCAKHNKEIGGANDSGHVKGNALDIATINKLILLYSYADTASKLFPGGTGIGFYPVGRGNIVHIDRRIISARWIKLEKYHNFDMQLKKEYLK